ncbi:MAG: hypothetical protein D6798_12275 [Deltaproteobacteria bacterium]|nr:MAG: hypothetical protein D6798_12275 [Deltaproteobacteria bacterium]
MTLVLGLMVACSADFAEEQAPLTVADWGGPVDGYVELVEPDNPQGAGIMIEFHDGGWVIRYGTSWSEGDEVARYDASATDAGYRVDDSMLVPAPVEVGNEAEGSVIEARGELTVWYGTFPDVVTVDVGGGPFAGVAAFAPRVGPVTLSWSGKTWELAYYE